MNICNIWRILHDHSKRAMLIDQSREREDNFSTDPSFTSNLFRQRTAQPSFLHWNNWLPASVLHRHRCCSRSSSSSAKSIDNSLSSLCVRRYSSSSGLFIDCCHLHFTAYSLTASAGRHDGMTTIVLLRIVGAQLPQYEHETYNANLRRSTSTGDMDTGVTSRQSKSCALMSSNCCWFSGLRGGCVERFMRVGGGCF